MVRRMIRSIITLSAVVGMASSFTPGQLPATTTTTSSNFIITTNSHNNRWMPTNTHQILSASSALRKKSFSRLNTMSKEELELQTKKSSSVGRTTGSSNNVGSLSLSSVEQQQQHEEQQIYKTAIQRTLAWVGAAAAFGTGLFFFFGPTTSEEFFAGYLLEQSLSVDNLLVFLLLFEYFQIPQAYQNRVLNWGILGALVMRAIMIGLGSVAIQQFHVVLLGFAAVLLYSSVKILFEGDDDDGDEDLSDNAIVQFSRKLLKSTDKLDGDRFFTMINGEKLATPMLLCLVAVEFSDVVFAVDSVPAVFGVTENPLVVFTSNMFAIMGLRSLYIILSKAASDLKYLQPAVALILGFIGIKLILEYMGINVPTEASLGVVLSLLGFGVGASLLDNDPPDDDL